MSSRRRTCSSSAAANTHYLNGEVGNKPHAAARPSPAAGISVRCKRTRSAAQNARAFYAPRCRNAGAAQERFAPKEDRGVSAELVVMIDDGDIWDETVARARLAVPEVLRAGSTHRAVDELRAPCLRPGVLIGQARVRVGKWLRESDGYHSCCYQEQARACHG
jgi:hypothetical protein